MVVVGLGLKDDAKTSLQSCLFRRLGCRDRVLALVLVCPRRPNFQSYPNIFRAKAIEAAFLFFIALGLPLSPPVTGLDAVQRKSQIQVDAIPKCPR
jgi:hypothetical protein